MKKVFLLSVLLVVSFLSYSQSQRKAKKLTTTEASQKTSDQRLVYETDRKSKKGKKKKPVSVKKKVRIEEKQESRVRKMKDPKRKRPR